MKTFIVLCLLSINTSVFAEYLGEAPIDSEYEDKLYNIYAKFHNLQMSSSEWQSITANRNVDRYSVQKKDNLWSISEVLFGDANYWPKLWSLNAYIKNPHRINVGDELYVVMGSEAEAPQAVVGEGGAVEEAVGEEVIAPPADTTIESGAIDQPDVQVVNLSQDADSIAECQKTLSNLLDKPGSTRVYSESFKCRKSQARLKERVAFNTVQIANVKIDQSPLVPRLRDIPASLPPIYLRLAGGINTQNLETRRLATNNLIDRYLANPDDIRIIGRVDDYEGIPVRTSEVIVTLDIPVSKGTRLTLIRPLKQIDRRNLSIGGPFGYEVVVQGVIEITDPVPNEVDYFFARVKQMYNPISRESQIIEGAPSTFDFNKKPNWGQGSAQIVGTSEDHSRNMLMAHSIVYLNRGKIDGIHAGETLQIWANPSFHRKVSKKPLGNVFIVHSSDNFATGFVQSLSDVAYVGDYLRPHSGVFGYDSEAMQDVYDDDDADLEDDDDYIEEEQRAQERDVVEEDEDGFDDELNTSFEEPTQQGENNLEDEEDLEEEFNTSFEEPEKEDKSEEEYFDDEDLDEEFNEVVDTGLEEPEQMEQKEDESEDEYFDDEDLEEDLLSQRSYA